MSERVLMSSTAHRNSEVSHPQGACPHLELAIHLLSAPLQPHCILRHLQAGHCNAASVGRLQANTVYSEDTGLTPSYAGSPGGPAGKQLLLPCRVVCVCRRPLSELQTIQQLDEAL